MPKLISDKGIPMDPDLIDKDDFWFEADSDDSNLSEFISSEDSNGTKDAPQESDIRRVLKRKSSEEDENKPSTAQWGEILKISGAPQMSTVKRFKIEEQEKTVGAISMEKENFIALKQAKVLPESKSSLENDEKIKELSEKTGLSESYLLNTHAVRMLAESFLKNQNTKKRSNSSKQEETEVCSKKESPDTIPKISPDTIPSVWKKKNAIKRSGSSNQGKSEINTKKESSETVPEMCSESIPKLSSDKILEILTDSVPSFLQKENVTKESCYSGQEKSDVSLKNETSDTIRNMSSDTLSKMSITIKQSETQSKAISLKANEKCVAVENPLTTPQKPVSSHKKINPLRAFRIYKSKNSTPMKKTTTKINTKAKKQENKHSLDACRFDTCTTLQPQGQIELSKSSKEETPPSIQIELSKTSKEETPPSIPPVEQMRETVLSRHISLPNVHDFRCSLEEQAKKTEPSRINMDLDTRSAIIQRENYNSSPEYTKCVQSHNDKCDICHYLKLGERSLNKSSATSLQTTSSDPQQLSQINETEFSREGYSQNGNSTASHEHCNGCTFCQHLKLGEHSSDKCSTTSLQKTSSVSQQHWQTNQTEPSDATLEHNARPTILQHGGYNQQDISNTFSEYSKQTSQQTLHDGRSTFCQQIDLGERGTNIHSATSLPGSSSNPQQLCQKDIIQPSLMLEQILKTPKLQHAMYNQNQNCKTSLEHSMYQHLNLGENNPHKPSANMISVEQNQIWPTGNIEESALKHYANSTILQHGVYSQNDNSKTFPKHSEQTSQQILYKDRYPIPQEVRLIELGSAKPFDTYLQKTTSYLEQLEQKRRAENRPILIDLQGDARSTILQQQRNENIQDRLPKISHQEIWLGGIPKHPQELPKIPHQEIWIKEIPDNSQHRVLEHAHAPNIASHAPNIASHAPNIASLQQQYPQELINNSTKQIITTHPQQFRQNGNIEPSPTFMEIPTNGRYVFLEPPQIVEVIEKELPSIPRQEIWIRGNNAITQPIPLLNPAQPNNIAPVHTELTTLQIPKNAKSITFYQTQLPGQSKNELSKPSVPVIWGKRMPKNARQTTLQSFEQQQYKPTSQDKNIARSQYKSPETLQLNEFSNNSLKQVEDAFNVNLAAEALSLLKTNSNNFFKLPKERVNADSTSQQNEKPTFGDTTLHKFSEIKTQSGSSSLSEKQKQIGARFDSTLEITDAVTGVRIPFESLCLNSSQISEIEPIGSDITTEKHVTTSDKLKQLSDSVTCVKVLGHPSTLPRIEETAIKRNEPLCTTGQKFNVAETEKEKLIPMQDVTKYVKHPLGAVSLPRNEEITNEKIKARYRALEELELPENPTKHVLSDKTLQLSNGGICVDAPLEGTTKKLENIGLPTNEDITKEKTDSSSLEELELPKKPTNHVLPDQTLQLSNGGICVDTPLEGITKKIEDIDLPKNADVTKEKTDSRFSIPKQTNVGITKSHIISNSLLQMPYRSSSTVVKIPLEAIFLPKHAATGMRIPIDAPCWPRNRVLAEKELSLSKPQNIWKSSESNSIEDNSLKKMQQENQKIRTPTPFYGTSKKIVKSRTPKYNIKKQFGSIGNFERPNILSKTKKLPLEPRLRKARTAHIQELNEIRRCHMPAEYLQPKPILTTPKLLKNEVKNMETNKSQISTPKLFGNEIRNMESKSPIPSENNKPILTTPKVLENESSNMPTNVTKLQLVGEDEIIDLSHDISPIPTQSLNVALVPPVCSTKTSEDEIIDLSHDIPPILTHSLNVPLVPPVCSTKTSEDEIIDLSDDLSPIPTHSLNVPLVPPVCSTTTSEDEIIDLSHDLSAIPTDSMNVPLVPPVCSTTTSEDEIIDLSHDLSAIPTDSLNVPLVPPVCSTTTSEDEIIDLSHDPSAIPTDSLNVPLVPPVCSTTTSEDEIIDLSHDLSAIPTDSMNVPLVPPVCSTTTSEDEIIDLSHDLSAIPTHSLNVQLVPPGCSTTTSEEEIIDLSHDPSAIPSDSLNVPLVPPVCSTKTSDGLMTESQISPSVVHPSHATKPVIIPQKITRNAKLQNVQEGLKPVLSYTYPRVQNLIKNVHMNTLGMFNREQIKRETISQQIEEFRKPELSNVSSQVSNITKRKISRLGLVKKKDLKKDKATSHKVVTTDSTSAPNTPIPMADEVKTIRNPVEAFKLLINDDMIRRILKHTNARITHLSDMSRRKRNSFKYSVSENELKAFLGLLLISGALRHNQATIPEIWSECYGAGIYRATLQEQRFQILSQCICLGDGSCRDKCIIRDEFTNIGDLYEEYLNNCKKYSIPCLPTKTNEKTDNTTNGSSESIEDTHIYSTARKTVNMPLRVLFSMLDGAGVRGLAMFNHVNPTIKLRQREFLKQVGMSLVRPYLLSKLMKLTLRRRDRELIESILNRKCERTPKSPSPPFDNCFKKQKRCQLCAWNKDRKTKYQCECCQRAMCEDHRADLCIECVKELM